MAIYQTFDKRNRNAGTYTSAGVLNIPAPASHVTLRGLMDLADIQDPTLQIRFSVEGSFDAQGLNWSPLFGAIWQGSPTRIGPGGVSVPNDRPPTITYSGAWPLHYRAVVDIPRRISIGLEIEVV